MKELLEEYLNDRETPEDIKPKVIKSARRYIFIKEMGELFFKNLPDAGYSIFNTLQNNRKNGKRE